MLPEAIENTLVLPFNDCAALEAMVKAQGQEIAAIILEPIPHNIGCVLPKPEFVSTLRRLCDDHGIILIFDEVITGFRHGLGGYQEKLGILPDLTTMAKAIANGYPCAVLAGREDLMMRFSSAGGDVFVAGTYNGHPVATSAALATIAELEDGSVHEQIFRLGDKARRGMQEIADRLDIDMTVAGYGSVFVPYFMSGPITRLSGPAAQQYRGGHHVPQRDDKAWRLYAALGDETQSRLGSAFGSRYRPYPHCRGRCAWGNEPQIRLAARALFH